jgi:hypothetical protein
LWWSAGSDAIERREERGARSVKGQLHVQPARADLGQRRAELELGLVPAGAALHEDLVERGPHAVLQRLASRRRDRTRIEEAAFLQEAPMGGQGCGELGRALFHARRMPRPRDHPGFDAAGVQLRQRAGKGTARSRPQR